MKKFKRYISVLPIVFMLLMSCVPIGSALADDDNSEYFLSLDDFDYPERTDIDIVRTYVMDKLAVTTGSTLSKLNSRDYTNAEYYFYSIYQGTSNRNKYVNNTADSVFSFDYYLLSDTAICYEDDTYIVYDTVCCPSFICTVDVNGEISEYSQFFSGTSTNSSHDWFCYNKVTGSSYHRSSIDCPTSFTGDVFSSLRTQYYVYYQESNIPDFPYAHEYSSHSALNVSVSFTPDLSGSLIRERHDGSNIYTIETLNVSISNNSSFPIQYSWFIVPHGADFTVDIGASSFSYNSGQGYIGSPTYAYITDEWCYLPKYDGSAASDVVKAYSPNTWHYMSARSSDELMVSFSQMKLIADNRYDVYVYAIRNDKDCVLTIPSNVVGAHPRYNLDYALNFHESVLVYSSTFLSFSSTPFDADSGAFGVYSFDPDDQSIGNLFRHSSAYEDDYGNVVVSQVDTNDFAISSDSWGYSYSHNAWSGSSNGSKTVSNDIASFSYSFSSFFNFINTTLGYFPKNYLTVVTVGLTSLVVLGILKGVFR